MKTYEEIFNDVLGYHFKNVSHRPVDIRKEAAKAYAKQWVHEFALQTFHHIDARAYNDLLTQLEPRIKEQIDAQ